MINVTLGKHTFEVIANEDGLIKMAKSLETFKENTFTGFEQSDEESLTEEEFNKNVELFVSEIKMACQVDYIETIVSHMPKKKNGTFYKGRKHVVSYYENTNFFQEWHNTWGTYELRFSATSDLKLELQIVKYNHTPA